jgi:hypothetical protein
MEKRVLIKKTDQIFRLKETILSTLSTLSTLGHLPSIYLILIVVSLYR